MIKEPSRRLTPARPDASDEAAGYMPAIAWRYIALGAMTVAIIGGSYWWNERSKVQALRAAIVRAHRDTLAEATERYVAFRDDITSRVLLAASRTPGDAADDQLRISGLRGSAGLYLRLRREEATNPDAVARAASVAEPDVIASCMGLAPLSARGLYDRGAFLLPGWLDEARTTDSVIRLRVIEDELSRRVKRDLSSVLSLLQSRWFLLVLEHGPRDRSPVDVFLWDLREKDALLEARIQSRGVLMSTQLRIGGARPASSPLPPDTNRSGAHDCSIGAQIKELAGSPIATVHSAPPPTSP